MANYTAKAILAFFGIPWLGHGRFGEFLIVLGTFVYITLFLITPHAAAQSKTTLDVYWLGYGAYILPSVIFKILFSASGLLTNIIGGRFSLYSRWARAIGAALGIGLWSYFGYKYYVEETIASWGFVWCVIAWYTSMRIIVLAKANIPIPGFPGVIGPTVV